MEAQFPTKVLSLAALTVVSLHYHSLLQLLTVLNCTEGTLMIRSLSATFVCTFLIKIQSGCTRMPLPGLQKLATQKVLLVFYFSQLVLLFTPSFSNV